VLLLLMSYADVRPLGQPNLQSWVYAAAQTPLDGDSVRAVRMMRVELRPLPVESWTSRQTYNITVDVDSVTWDSGSLDTFTGYQLEPGGDGPSPAMSFNESTIIDATIHAHLVLMWDVLFFQGRPDQVFADLELAAPSKHKTEYGNHMIPQTLANIRKRQLQPDRANLACSYKTGSDGERMPIGGGEYETFARMPRCNIDPTKPEFVLIALHHNFGAYHTGHFEGAPGHEHSYRTTARMHAYVRVYYAEKKKPLGICENINTADCQDWCKTHKC